MCLVPIQASTLEVVGRGIAVLRSLEGSLGGAEVIRGIATWSYACDKPERLNLLRFLALSTKLLYNVPPHMAGIWGGEACLAFLILSQEEPHPRVPFAWVVTMVDAWGWGPFLLGGLPVLDDCLPTTWCARGSDLWKLGTTALSVGARPKSPRLISIL